MVVELVTPDEMPRFEGSVVRMPPDKVDDPDKIRRHRLSSCEQYALAHSGRVDLGLMTSAGIVAYLRGTVISRLSLADNAMANRTFPLRGFTPQESDRMRPAAEDGRR